MRGTEISYFQTLMNSNCVQRPLGNTEGMCSLDVSSDLRLMLWS